MKKGAKRKCTQCSTLFFDFGKSPIVCPNCGADVNSLLTNVSKRGRPPKAVKVQQAPQDSEIEIEEIEVQENIVDDVNDDDSVEDMIEIDRKEEQLIIFC